MMTGLGNMDDAYNYYLKVIVEKKQLEKKLKIAIDGLEKYANEGNWESTMYGAKDCFFIPNGERRVDGFLLARRVLEELDK